MTEDIKRYAQLILKLAKTYEDCKINSSFRRDVETLLGMFYIKILSNSHLDHHRMTKADNQRVAKLLKLDPFKPVDQWQHPIKGDRL